MKPLTMKKENTGKVEFGGLAVQYPRGRKNGKLRARAGIESFFRRVNGGKMDPVRLVGVVSAEKNKSLLT